MATMSIMVGEITVVPLSDGGMAGAAAGILPSVSAEQWAAFREFLNPDGTIPLNFGAFLVREHDAWTLVDTGVGGRADSPGGTLRGQMEQAGVRPEQVGRVIITHLHRDHIGWNTIDRDGRTEPLFRNARYVVQRRDLEYFEQPERREATSAIETCVQPLQEAGLLDVIEGDRAFSAGISALFTPGHTPGHQSVLLASGGEKAIITGDVTHTPAQVTHPEWSPAFDVDPELSARTRAAVWERIEQEGLVVCAGHYPYPSIGGFARVEGKRRWRPRSPSPTR